MKTHVSILFSFFVGMFLQAQMHIAGSGTIIIKERTQSPSKAEDQSASFPLDDETKRKKIASGDVKETRSFLESLTVEIENRLKDPAIDSKSKELLAEHLKSTRDYRAQLDTLPVDLRICGLVGNGVVEMASAEQRAAEYREAYKRKTKRIYDGTINKNWKEWLEGNVVLSSL